MCGKSVWVSLVASKCRRPAWRDGAAVSCVSTISAYWLSPIAGVCVYMQCICRGQNDGEREELAQYAVVRLRYRHYMSVALVVCAGDVFLVSSLCGPVRVDRRHK